MPKFTIEMNSLLNKSLQNLGLIIYKIDKIIQKAKIIVDAKRTEVAAATGLVCASMGMPKYFQVNRPFLYLIRNKKAHTILFEGFVKNPNL